MCELRRRKATEEMGASGSGRQDLEASGEVECSCEEWPKPFQNIHPGEAGSHTRSLLSVRWDFTEMLVMPMDHHIK